LDSRSQEHINEDHQASSLANYSQELLQLKSSHNVKPKPVPKVVEEKQLPVYSLPQNPIKNPAYRVHYVQSRIQNERIDNLQLTASLGYKLDYASIQNKLNFMGKEHQISSSYNNSSMISMPKVPIVKVNKQTYVQNRKQVSSKNKLEMN